MKAQDLKKVLERANKFIDRSPLPILNAVYFTGTYAVTTNLEWFVKIPFETDFPFVVYPKELIKFIGNYKGDIKIDRISKVELVEEEKITYTYFANLDGASMQLETFDPLDYPILPETKVNNFYMEGDNELISILSKIVSFAKEDESRQVIRKIQFEIKDGLMKLIATDGHRLSIINSKTTSYTDNVSFRVPGKFVNLLKRAKDKIFKFSYTPDGEDNDIVSFFGLDGTEYAIKNYDCTATFPPYNQIIPKETWFVWQVNTKELLDIVTKMYDLLKKQDYPIITITPNEIISNGYDIFPVIIPFKGFPFCFNINAKYLKEALEVIDSPVITMKSSYNWGSPIVFETDNLYQLIMPVKSPTKKIECNCEHCGSIFDLDILENIAENLTDNIAKHYALEGNKELCKKCLDEIYLLEGAGSFKSKEDEVIHTRMVRITTDRKKVEEEEVY
jgi:DNA polymerase-3 subunit beta